MDTNILAAFISAGVSIFITSVYWFGKLIYNLWVKKKQFNTYKNYAIEFLENCIQSSESDIFKYSNIKTYTLNQLDIELIHLPTNIKCESSTHKVEYIPIITLGFLSLKYLLDKNERHLLRYILDNMCEEYKWFRMGNYNIQHPKYSTATTVNFVEFNIQDMDGNILSFLDKDCFILLTTNTDTKELKALRKELENNEFDDRIKKAIKQWESNNPNN